jgi:hypothetical protein
MQRVWNCSGVSRVKGRIDTSKERVSRLGRRRRDELLDRAGEAERRRSAGLPIPRRPRTTDSRPMDARQEPTDHANGSGADLDFGRPFTGRTPPRPTMLAGPGGTSRNSRARNERTPRKGACFHANCAAARDEPRRSVGRLSDVARSAVGATKSVTSFVSEPEPCHVRI